MRRHNPTSRWSLRLRTQGTKPFSGGTQSRLPCVKQTVNFQKTTEDTSFLTSVFIQNELLYNLNILISTIYLFLMCSIINLYLLVLVF